MTIDMEFPPHGPVRRGTGNLILVFLLDDVHRKGRFARSCTPPVGRTAKQSAIQFPAYEKRTDRPPPFYYSAGMSAPKYPGFGSSESLLLSTSDKHPKIHLTSSTSTKLSTIMSSAAAVKLSPALKSLIAAPHALGSPVPSPSKRATLALFDKIRSEGESGGVEPESWLTVSSAALVTVNSPETVCALFDYAKERRGGLEDQVMAAAVSGMLSGLSVHLWE